MDGNLYEISPKIKTKPPIIIEKKDAEVFPGIKIKTENNMFKLIKKRYKLQKKKNQQKQNNIKYNQQSNKKTQKEKILK